MLFSEVVGQQTAKNNLIQMWQQNHLPHALLICGQSGTGSLPLAIALAQYVFCEQRTPADACGVCASCMKVSKLEHADLHFSFPSIAPKPGVKAMSKHFIKEFREFILKNPYGTTFDWLQNINAENKQGNITAEESRAIIESLSLKAYEGGMKILIIWRPEYLGKEGNMLLKLIEEPPANTIIIFAAENLENIIPTILSRTQVVKLPPITISDMTDKLTSLGIADARLIHQAARLSSGSYPEAVRLLTDVENDLFPQTRNWFNVLFTNNGIGLSRFAEDFAKMGREQQKNMLQYVIHLLETTIHQRYTGHCNLIDDELSFVQKLAKTSMSFESIQIMIREITAVMYHIERNANAKMQVHALSIKLVYAIQNKQVSSLIN